MFSTLVNHLKQSKDTYNGTVTREFKMTTKMPSKMAPRSK